MTICCVVGCTSRPQRKKDSGITLHRFPKSVEVRKEWISAVKKGDWSPSNYSSICSLHFEDHYFDRRGKCVKLAPDAVPTVFPTYPSFFQVETCQPEMSDESPVSPPETESSASHLFGEANYPDQTPESESSAEAVVQEYTDMHYQVSKLEDELERVRGLYRNAKRRIKLLQQRDRRAIKRRASLQDIISALKRPCRTWDDQEYSDSSDDPFLY